MKYYQRLPFIIEYLILNIVLLIFDNFG